MKDGSAWSYDTIMPTLLLGAGSPPDDSRLSGGPAACLPGAYDSMLLATRQLSVRRPRPAVAGAG